jgi:hypothetical protein
MRETARGRSEQERSNRIVEVICVLIVLGVVAALIAWVVVHHGGGVLNQG